MSLRGRDLYFSHYVSFTMFTLKVRITPNAITRVMPRVTFRATLVTMLFELWASRADTGPQLKQHCPKSREGRRAGHHTSNCVGVFCPLRYSYTNLVIMFSISQGTKFIHFSLCFIHSFPYIYICLVIFQSLRKRDLYFSLYVLVTHYHIFTFVSFFFSLSGREIYTFLFMF